MPDPHTHLSCERGLYSCTGGELKKPPHLSLFSLFLSPLTQPQKPPHGAWAAGWGSKRNSLAKGKRMKFENHCLSLCFGSWTGLGNGGKPWGLKLLISLIKKENRMCQIIYSDGFPGHTYQLCSYCGMALQKSLAMCQVLCLVLYRHYLI